MTDSPNFDAQLRTTALAYVHRHGEQPATDLELATCLRARLPTSAPRYRSLRVEALRVLVAAAGDEPEDPALLCDYGLELLGVGAREAAATQLERATQRARAALDRGDSELARSLARALDGHACARMALGESARAAELGAEAIALLEPIAAHDRAGASLELARASNNLSNALSELGKRVQAYAAVERSTELYRALADEDERHRSSLAAVLSNLGASLSELGDDRGAVAAAQEAVALLRETQAQAESTTGNAELARALHNLANSTLDLGDHGAGHAAAVEAAQAYRGLAELLPQAFCADLVDALDTLSRALILSELEHELVVVMLEANAVHQRLVTLDGTQASQRRSAYAKRSLKLCARLSARGEAEQAVHWAEQAIASYGELAREEPKYRTKLAAAQQHRSVNLSLAGRDAEALEASRETAAAWQVLAEEDGEQHTTKLIAALQNLAQDLDTLGHQREAVETSTRVVDLLEPLASEAPAEYGGALVESLANLALDLAGLEQHTDALQRATQAVEQARPLATADPDSYEPDLAHALDVKGSIEAALGRPEAAFASYGEGLQRLAPHYAIEPEDYGELRDELLADLRALCESSGMPWPSELD